MNSYFALFQSTVGVPLGVRECVYIKQLLSAVNVDSETRAVQTHVLYSRIVKPCFHQACAMASRRTSMWLVLHIVCATFQQGIMIDANFYACKDKGDTL